MCVSTWRLHRQDVLFSCRGLSGVQSDVGTGGKAL